MAEYNFENPTYGKDDYDEFDKEDMDADDEFEETIQNQGAHIVEVPQVATRTQLIVEQKESIVKEYYKLIKERYGLDPSRIDITNFELGSDNKTLYLKVGDKEILITSKRGGSFINLNTLASRIGEGGTSAIRDFLSLPTYTSAVKPLSAQAVATLQKVENNLPDIDSVEMTDLPNTAETLVKEIETSFIDLERDETGTQTDMTKREMDGILKAMASVKEEIANELAKLNETNKHLAKENTK